MLDVKSIEDFSPLAIGSEDNEPDEFRPFPTAEAGSRMNLRGHLPSQIC